MPEPVRLVQVGAGAMGQAWLRTIAASPDVVLVGLVDLDADVARRAAADHGLGDVAIGTDLGAVLAEVDADGVVNVTVPRAHRETSEVALAAGVPVLCEKPLADTVAAAWAMVEAAERAGRLLMVSQSRRYWRNLVAYRRQIEQIGPVGTVACQFFKAPHFGGFREQMAEPLLVDMAIHQFDLARLLIGADPVTVSCDAYNPSWSWFAGNAAAEAERSRSPTAAGSASAAAGARPGRRRRGTGRGGSAAPAERRPGTVTTCPTAVLADGSALTPGWSATAGGDRRLAGGVRHSACVPGRDPTRPPTATSSAWRWSRAPSGLRPSSGRWRSPIFSPPPDRCIA